MRVLPARTGSLETASSTAHSYATQKEGKPGRGDAWKGYPSKGVVGKACDAHEAGEAYEIGDAGGE